MASPERSKQKEAASIDPHAVQAQYRKDTVILLNRQGVQEQFKLENTGQILAGKFVVEVTPVGGGPRERLELPVVPEIVPFQTGAVIGEYTVDALTPTKDGTVEYTVTTRSGERLLRIPKELLEGVQAVDAIEKQLNEVGKDIRHVVGEKAKDLQERQAKMKSLFLQVQSELGGTFKKGQAFTKKEVEVFTKKFDTIVEKSLTALEELQKELKEHLDTEKRKVVVAGQVFTDGQKVFYTQRGGTPEEYKVKIDATQLGRPAPKNIILEGKDARGNVVTFAVSEQAVRDRLLFAAEPSMSKLNQKDFGFKHFAKTEKEKAAEAEILAAERKKDVEDAKSEYETRKAIVLRIKKLFDEDIPRFVDKKLKDSLALLREEELDFYEQQLALYKQDLADWDARNNHKWLTQKSRPTDPPPKDRKVYQDPSDPLPLFPQRPQRDKIVYTPKEIEQQKESAIGDYIFSIMSGNGILDIDQPQVSDFIYEVNLRRFDRAEKELLAGKTEVDATTGILDYKESLYKWEVTRDIIKEVIHDWSKDFTPPKEKPAPTQTFPEGELVFDLDVEIGEATKHTGELLVAVHGRDAVNEHILLGIETDISTLWGVLLSAKDAVDFKKNKTVQAYLDLSPKKQIDIETKLQSGDIKVQQQGVNELRVAVLKGVYAKLRTIESAIASLQEGDVRRAVVKATEEAEKNAKKILKETQDDIAKRDVEKRAKATESEKITRKIDLPPHIIKELLGRNATRVEAIMQQLYVGIFEAGPSGSKQIKQQTQDAFRNLFDGVSLPAALQNELATYGITNWDMFLGTWKDHLALPVAEVMSQAAESKIKQMVAEKMSTFGATLKKMKKMSGQIVGRALLTAGLVGGASLGVASIPGIFAAFGAWGVIGSSAAAGATAGGVRGMLNKWLFGGEKAQAKAAQKMQEVEDEMHDDILNNLKLNNPETFNLFAHVLSQTTREVTNTIAGKEKTGIAEVDALDVNARSLYEEALAGMEETNIDTEQQRQLAIAISRMSQKGNVLTKETVASMDKRVLGALDGLVGKYTGQKGIMPAIVTGAAIGTLLAGIRSTAESVQEAGDVSRATMGALFGAVAGLRYAEKRRYDSERKDAQAVLERRKNNIELRIYQIKRNPTSVAPFLAAARADVAAIEKMLRGKGVKEDVVALTYLVKKEKPKRGKFDTEQIEDADFAIFTDEELVKHLQSLVHEARRAGIMQERKEDAYDLQKAMDTLQKQGNALEEKATKGLGARLLSWGKKQGDRFVWMAGGAVVGGVSALAIGNMFRLGAEKAGIIHAPTAEMDKAIAASAAGFEKTSGGVSAALGGAGALESHSDASWLERLGKSFDDLVDKAKSAGSKLADMSDAMSPEVTAASIAERLGILNETLGGADAKGKNVLHLANVLEKDAAQRTFIIAQERAAHADYKGLTDNQVIHKWRVGLAKDAGWDFTTKTFDKTPLYQVTDSSGKTHTIEYKPYMKPDGTVGIKADDMFVLEHGAKSFAPVTPVVPEKTPEMKFPGEVPPSGFKQANIDGDMWNVPARGVVDGSYISRKLDDGTVLFRRWDEAGEKWIDVPNSEPFAKSIGAMPGTVTQSTFDWLFDKHGFSRGDVESLERYGYFEKDGQYFVREKGGNVAISNGELQSPVDRSEAGLVSRSMYDSTETAEEKIEKPYDMRAQMDAEMQKTSTTFKNFYNTELSSSQRIDALRGLLRESDGGFVEYNGLKYRLGANDTVRFETPSGVASAIVTKDNINALSELDTAFAKPGNNTAEIKEIVGRVLSGGTSSPVEDTPIELPPRPEPVEVLPQEPPKQASAGVEKVSVDTGVSPEQAAIYENIKRTSGTAIAFVEAATKGDYSYFLPGVTITPELKYQIDTAVQAFDVGYNAADTDGSTLMKADLLQKIEGWKNNGKVAGR